jgi:tetratricopeptide (TPR) repeat protein
VDPLCLLFRAFHVIGLSLLLVAVIGCGTRQPEATPVPPSSLQPSSLQRAAELNQAGRTDEALAATRQALIESPDDRNAMAFAIELYAEQGQYKEAAEIAEQLASVDRASEPAILVNAADYFLRAREYAEVERCLEQALASDPKNVTATRMMAQWLSAQGRRVTASEFIESLLRSRAATHLELLSMIDRTDPFDLVDYGDLIDRSANSMFMLGDARKKLSTRASPAEILQMTGELMAMFPQEPAVSAFHGRVAVDTGQREQVERWLQKLPPGIESHADYWHAIGGWMAQQGKHPEAVRAFGESVRRDPTARESLRSMIVSLSKLERDQAAEHVRETLSTLDHIYRVARDADAKQSEWISEQMMELVRPWESLGWLKRSHELAGTIDREMATLFARHNQVAAWETGGSAEKIVAARVRRMLGFELEQWPMPMIDAKRSSVPLMATVKSREHFQFQDVATELGISTTHRSGFNGEGDFHPYQINGGGLAAFDYDLDGRCDVYVVQAGGKPNDNNGSDANQLFRLSDRGTYGEVTQFAAADDRGYGQGVCAGDANQDGLLDLLVANIGYNQLYINQGDGTFRQAENLITQPVPRWTSSVAIADLSGDHLPELIEINYINDPKALTAWCAHDLFACQPQRFISAADHIDRGHADGTFSPWKSFERRNNDPKFGFGLVIANFDGKHGNDFFVSNDGDLNHYWVSDPGSDESGDRFGIVESAVPRGCSVGRGGNSQACMGIASGDFDRNGMLDLHVTNFFNEPVNLFMQTRSGFFSDEALQYRLTEPSFGVLGFGTQAADFDNDGWLDLVVLNGHVFDMKDPAIPYRMPPQLFAGAANGFDLLKPSTLGSYGTTQHLGRTVAILDWNRDGKLDWLASHLDSPIALMENRSTNENWLQLEFVGTTSERDAIGASVRVVAGDQQWTHWQTGGDGYMCTNEAIVHVGVGTAAKLDRIEVTWPSGQTQSFDGLPSNHRFLIVEGDDRAWSREAR